MKSYLLIFLLGVLLVFGSVGYAAGEKTPENAADLYRKAFELYQPDEDETYAIYQLLSGEKENYEVVEAHIKANRKVIDIAVKASRMKNCDWDMRLSGFDPEDPNTSRNDMNRYYEARSSMRDVANLILADAKVHAHRSEIDKAVERTMTGYAISRHIDSNYIMGYLASMSVELQVDHLLSEILSENRLDISKLNHIEKNLKNHLKLRQPLIETIEFETQFDYESLGKVTLEWLKDSDTIGYRYVFDDPNILDEVLKSDDEEYTEFSPDYFQSHYHKIRDAIDMPYPKAVAIFEKLENDLSADAVKFGQSQYKAPKYYTAFMMEVTTAAFLWPNIHSMHVMTTTRLKALLTAIDIYKIKAKTGKLTDKIPAGSPKDLFSSEDFVYERNADGFILRSKGKNPYIDEIYEWEFKVAK